MSTPRSQRSDPLDTLRPPPAASSHSRNASASSTLYGGGEASSAPSNQANATYATFSPTASNGARAASAAKRRSTILVHQKSPLLLATPPQITRALAYSHPFLLPLNKFVGLLSWTTDDSWESFLVVVVYWAVVLYGDVAVRVAGPLVVVLVLIAGMYGRRYSPLSSSGWSDGVDGPFHHSAPPAKKQGHKKQKSGQVDGAGNSTQGTAEDAEATSTRHQKTLDEIVDTLREFTARCNVLLEPLLEMTDFLSTQRTPTSATTRPALTTLFVRILLCTPFWYALTLGPLRIVTTRRVALVIGTVGLTWHAKPMKVSRTILWRSGTIRRLCSLVTGLQFEVSSKAGGAKQPTPGGVSTTSAVDGVAKPPPGLQKGKESELTKAIRQARGGPDAGVRFTFIIYENQRRWVGLGWTTSLFAYERPAWTDEHNNAVPPRLDFELPEVEDGSKMRWQWADSSRWRVDGVSDDAVRVDKTTEDGENKTEFDYDGDGGRMGWVYYDNKWNYGRRGQDGWNRWTRRRKWYRDAELFQVDEAEAATDPHADNDHTPTPPSLPPRPTTPSMGGKHSRDSSGIPSIRTGEDGAEEEQRDRIHEEEDTVSLMSTSSRSGSRFKMPALRRRGNSDRASVRSRRASEAASEDDAAGLSRDVGLALQGAGSEGWGIGDDARMSLD